MRMSSRAIIQATNAHTEVAQLALPAAGSLRNGTIALLVDLVDLVRHRFTNPRCPVDP